MHADHVIVEQPNVDVELDFEVFELQLCRVAMVAEQMEHHGSHHHLSILVGCIDGDMLFI